MNTYPESRKEPAVEQPEGILIPLLDPPQPDENGMSSKALLKLRDWILSAESARVVSWVSEYLLGKEAANEASPRTMVIRTLLANGVKRRLLADALSIALSERERSARWIVSQMNSAFPDSNNERHDDSKRAAKTD